MKRVITVCVVAMLCGMAAYAQPRAIGGRTGSAIEASYQHYVGKNMFTIDFGFVYDIYPPFYNRAYYRGVVDALYGVEAVATHDWIFPIKSWKHKGEWNWFAGVGLGAGYHRYSVYGYYGGVDLGFVGVAGRIGFEYNFWFPLQLSFDWRPVIGPIFSGQYVFDSGRNKATYYTSGLYAGAICIGVRYLF